jgi:hypothetical protein
MRESVKKSTELFLCRRSFSEAVRPACLAIVKPWRDDGGSDCSEWLDCVAFVYWIPSYTSRDSRRIGLMSMIGVPSSASSGRTLSRP